MQPDDLTSLHARIEDVMAVATEARDEARGAHTQATRTNGRVDKLEGHMVTVRRTLWGSQDDALKNDGGLVGWMRQTRRDIRILGLLIMAVPAVVEVVDRIAS